MYFADNMPVIQSKVGKDRHGSERRKTNEAMVLSNVEQHSYILKLGEQV